ncbi:protein of unknown function [Microlunatus soli]|uniref:DUF4282 domain-containing protein n=1 Tax=Microlunatus soli TaxID=630515 RepID=A0A1H1V900_9ACTN|nr:protein of unknown function [Microlunatus soli]
MKAAFDFSFASYATPGLVKIIYILAVIIAAIGWIGSTISYFVLAATTHTAVSRLGGPPQTDTSVAMFISPVLLLLFGWVPGLLWVLVVRVVLEAALALVRAAEDVRAMRDKNLGPVS